MSIIRVTVQNDNLLIWKTSSVHGMAWYHNVPPGQAGGTLIRCHNQSTQTSKCVIGKINASIQRDVESDPSTCWWFLKFVDQQTSKPDWRGMNPPPEKQNGVFVIETSLSLPIHVSSQSISSLWSCSEKKRGQWRLLKTAKTKSTGLRSLHANTLEKCYLAGTMRIVI